MSELDSKAAVDYWIWVEPKSILSLFSELVARPSLAKKRVKADI